jgi:methyl-accepting chemotaxis protein
MIKPERQAESSDGEMSGEHLGTLLRQVSKTSIDEIDSLIVELKTLHKKLQTDGDRIQRDIEEHTELSQQVMQLTKIISDSVKKLPGRS